MVHTKHVERENTIKHEHKEIPTEKSLAPEYREDDPSPIDIIQMCHEIRKGWSQRTKKSRYVGGVESFAPTLIEEQQKQGSHELI